MKNTLTISALSTEGFTSTVTGPGSFSAYLDLSAMQSGDSVTIVQYADVLGTGAPIAVNSASVDYADLVAAGEAGIIAIPITLESAQTAKIGITLDAGTTPLLIPWRITNVKTNA